MTPARTFDPCQLMLQCPEITLPSGRHPDTTTPSDRLTVSCAAPRRPQNLHVASTETFEIFFNKGDPVKSSEATQIGKTIAERAPDRF